MKPFYGNLNDLALKNNAKKKYIYQTENIKVALMCLKPGQDLGLELHDDTTQMITIVRGMGIGEMNYKQYILSDGMTIIVPPNTPHNVINLSETDKMKMYTYYSPAEHSTREL